MIALEHEFKGARLKRKLIALVALLLLTGLALLAYAETFPIYWDASAPEKLSDQLEKSLSPQSHSRFDQWYARLPLYESPHKKLSDWGRGLIAAGLGMTGACGILWLHHRLRGHGGTIAILALWIALWLIRIPFSIWYYGVRQERFDYPIWGDSIGIPIYEESSAWILGAIISSIILGLLLLRHPLPPQIQFSKPGTPLAWIRSVFLILWLVVLGLAVITGIPDGDEGMVISCTGAFAIILIFLSATVKGHAEVPRQDALRSPYFP